MIFDYEPGDYVISPKNKEWGTGQIQSIIKNIVTVNFENEWLSSYWYDFATL